MKTAEEWAKEVMHYTIERKDENGILHTFKSNLVEIIQAAMNQAYDDAAEACWTPQCVWDSYEQEVCYKSCHDAIKNLKSGGGNG